MINVELISSLTKNRSHFSTIRNVTPDSHQTPLHVNLNTCERLILTPCQQQAHSINGWLMISLLRMQNEKKNFQYKGRLDI